ncbi:peptide-methionine (S)-S-oxide reductase MsrA [Psychromonas sp. Urea-02u-13]|uniref:peptide-methionine (S)-S-oxide reductase MsrA n=1 Tax=Psychromonas sp. Urea-02u-13 TaxID=2058326 RepID=UPI000C33F25E|nr:peptide-methionine (S)-S-oxide reductase MsrA [Psychromonas sp. Urea-02u-13]PKG37418.1 peptide-methionine (S)-S-oxide reductase [Psychromonas sp. Urea-02u-13]
MNNAQATFAGGCFWCIEAAFNSLDGVLSATSGYCGGETLDPTYDSICTGQTGHAEVVQISFDESIISYQALLEIFFTLHDATQLNRQGNDVGTQYRSAIFYHDQTQQQLANDYIEALTADAIFDAPIVTTVVPLETFYSAEAFHQGYYLQNPSQGYCAMVISPKFNKFKAKYADKLKT